MNHLLDAAVFINADSFPFSKSHVYFITTKVESEIREPTAKARLDAAWNTYDFRQVDPCPATLQKVFGLEKEHGNTRLSPADESILGLALEMKGRGEKIKVFTDDYSLQNALKWVKIPFSPILQKGIIKKRSFRQKK